MSASIQPGIARWMPVVHYITMGLTEIPLLPSNPSRLCVLFESSSLAGANISPQPNIPPLGGLVIDNGGSPVQFDYYKNPGLVQAAWFGFGIVGSVLTIIEILQVPSGEQ